MNKCDYTGKTVFVGIDVHKKTYSCVSIVDKEVVKKDRMPGRPEGLLRYLKNSFPGAIIRTAYEAGFSGFHLHRCLANDGINNMVVHAGSIEVASRDRVKTDKRDALKVATQLSAERLRSVFVPELEQEAKRAVTRLRTNILRLRHRVGQQFKSLLFTQGLIDSDDDTKLCKNWLLHKLSEVKEKGLPEEFYYCLNEYSTEWLGLTKRLAEITLKLKNQVKNDISLHTIYDSAPGIGLIHARELANELGDMKQFKNEKSLFSYTGLTPSEYSSGEHKRQGHITRQGKSRLRKILIEAAWKGIYQDPNLMEIFERLSGERGKKRAIVAVARRLIGRIRSCVLNGTLYKIKLTQETYSESNRVGVTSYQGSVAN
jgi:transposase